MGKNTGFIQLAEYVEKLGLETALALCGGWGGLTLYVPGRRAEPDHLITLVLGTDGAAALMEHYGSQTIDVPRIDLTAYSRKVRVITFLRRGFTLAETAREVGISRERVRQIEQEMTGEAGGPWKKSAMRDGRPTKNP